MNPYSAFDKKFNLPPLEDDCHPVFILSSIWRSGSTLLQRSVCTDKDIMVWGEPYADCNLISSMAFSTKALLQPTWPSVDNFVWNHPWVLENPHKFFIANVYPEPIFMRDSYRKLLDHLFWDAAKHKGFKRFGVKFVRIGLDEAHFLNWLYPNARFVFLIRNPWDCWRSYKGYRWIYRYPKQMITKVEHFAKLWLKHTGEFLQFSDPAMYLRYEDFLQPDFNWSAFSEFCELPNLTNAAMDIRIGGVDNEPQPVTEEDLSVISYLCGDLANQLGYIGLKNTDLSFNPFS